MPCFDSVEGFEIMSASDTTKEHINLHFSDDCLPGFEAATFELPREEDGELVATLIRTKDETSPASPRPAVLYVHGFVDYFFQAHLAAQFEEAGFRFYALDLRRYGRSIRENNRANMASSLDDYFNEITLALRYIAQEHGRLSSLIAHSTGGLIASLYMDRGEERALVKGLVLNSPFLHFNLDKVSYLKTKVAAFVAHIAPNKTLPDRLPSTYGQTLHQDEKGEWKYDLELKPLRGFPLYPSWFRMIHRGHRDIARGLALDVPVLSLCSSRSRSAVNDAPPQLLDFEADLVLNVDDIRTLSHQLGPDVSVKVIPGGMHDLTLSRRPAREQALRSMVEFAKAQAPT